ncbi:phospholipase A2 [Umezawaea sp. Da 62-37]|uniref:phospholipase A2 n=1 Tax=Umezawaea sp. Da 62-37 TaxID=3075927 RepID=UPI0028F72EED|nr:phospholipase A2 [Umezawaea sp. Da 62-37]WNV90496.1 phospholipase A2 [Umezawaea sp. Da 62-37]
MVDAPANDSGGWPGLRLLSRFPTWFRFLVVTLVVFVCGVIASRPAGATDDRPLSGEVAAAAKAVQAMTHPSRTHDPLDDFPADFGQVQGRSPMVVRTADGSLRAFHPDGECSGPAGETEWDFSLACKAHDLGYDLLRYAESKGQPLGPDARRDVDAQLSRDMQARCHENPRGSESQCRAVAQLYAGGLGFNSWRQRWGPPGHEPVLAWGFGSAMVVFLLLARLPGRRRKETAPAEFEPRPASQDRYATFLRLASLGLVVLGQSVLTVMHWAGVSANWLWLLTWALQAVTVFFFAGGHANLLSWQEVQADHGGYGRYLSSRISWLLRPVLGFVLAWLVLPLPLELLDVPKVRVEAFGRLIAYPLWFLGVYLVAVAVTPLMAWLHGRLRLGTPLALVVVMVSVDGVRAVFDWRTGGYLNLLLGAVFLQQLGFFYADGSLRRISRKVLGVVASLTVPVLLALITYGGYPRTMMALPGEASSNLSPPTVCLLVLAIGQICLVALLRDRTSTWLAGTRQWNVVAFARAAPMTVYLGYLTVLAAVVGVLGLLDAPDAAAFTVADWLARPRWLAVLVLLLMPVLLLFHRFERHASLFPGARWTTAESHRSRLAATLGVAFGALGVLGFVATGFAGTSATLIVLQVDPLQNLVHLLLGWYLLHTARAGTCHGRRSWLLAAMACVPPLLVLEPNTLGVVLHVATIVLALMAAVSKQHPSDKAEHRQPQEALV